MNLKALAEAMLYALAEAEFGAIARQWEPGIHARVGVVLDEVARQRRLQQLARDMAR